MEWEKLFRKYIWNEQTTPYFTSVPDLTRRQADSEILFYCWFHAILLGMIAIISLRGGPGGRSLGVSYYGFAVVCASVLFGILKNYAAALFLSATPLVGLAYIFLYGLGSERPAGDTLVVAIILLLFLRYSLRILNIARIYPFLPQTGSGKTEG